MQLSIDNLTKPSEKKWKKLADKPSKLDTIYLKGDVVYVIFAWTWIVQSVLFNFPEKGKRCKELNYCFIWLF